MKIPFVRLILLSAMLLVEGLLFGQTNVTQGAQTGEVKLLGSISELRNINPQTKLTKAKKNKGRYHSQHTTQNFQRYIPMPNSNLAAQPVGLDPVRQLFGFLSVLLPVEPIFNFEGIDVAEASNFPVPDPNGDVSPDHYVQITNAAVGSIFKIFNKDGSLLYGPASLNTFWEPFNISGYGSPIVLWDQGAQRWLFTELGEFGSNLMLVAISETSDPLGDWFVYSFHSPELPDYPKYGIWPDAYYVTTIESEDANIPIYALDRAAMLNGEPNVEMQRVGIPKFGAANSFAFQTATPVDWDGAASPPPVGSPHYVLRMYDDAWDGGQDKLEVWEIAIDWDNSDNTTVTGPIDLITAPFDSDVCNGSIFNCLAESDGSTVSAMMQVLMHRVQYRNFGNYETIVLNHVVDVNGNNLGGIRWYELRKPINGDWEIYQQGTFSPDDNHRFMGSIAVDAAGDIGLAYSTMGPSKNLSLAFTGRHPSDPLGEMTVDEYEFASGLSLHDGFRWGDYSMMAVDEVDGLTFWFTGEYMKANAAWGTRIVSFQLKEDSTDIGPVDIVSPESSAYLTIAEEVEVKVKNFGLIPQVDYKVGLLVDGNFIEEKIVTDSLYPDSIANIIFDTPIDMSVIKDYSFKIYTHVIDDANVFNDTLRTFITKSTRYDAAVTSFVDITSIICDTIQNVGIVITNKGAETLDSVLVEWSFNASLPFVYNWDGVLETDFSDTIFVLLDPLLGGINNIEARTFEPNGVEDEEIGNDMLSRTFEVVTDGETFYLNLLTDFYPLETSWKLTDEFGTVVYQKDQYTGSNTNYIEQWCLQEGCYTFTIFDSFGDGMSFGTPGAYSITDEAGHFLATIGDANFGQEETKEFCAPFVCMLEGEASTLKETYPNAFDGVIDLTGMNGFPPYQYSINGGDNFYPSPVFTGLGGNTYQVVIMDVNGCIVEMEVIVVTCTLQFSVVATNETTGQMDGSIQINVENGVSPYLYSIDNGMSFQDTSFFSDLSEGVYNILVQDSIGCIFILEITINAMGEVGLNEKGIIKTIEILPNPVKDIFKINISGLQDVNILEVELLDVAGRIIQRGHLAKNDQVLTGQMSLKYFSKGVYFLRFNHPELLRLKKILHW
jgi:type IX secretion system substrate protein/SprB-like repeat protein